MFRAISVCCTFRRVDRSLVGRRFGRYCVVWHACRQMWGVVFLFLIWNFLSLSEAARNGLCFVPYLFVVPFGVWTARCGYGDLFVVGLYDPPVARCGV